MGVLPAVPDAKTGPSVCQAKGVREGATRSPGSDYRLLLSFVLRLNSEGLNHLRMQFKGLEGVFHVRELGLFGHPLHCVPEQARDSRQQGVLEARIERLVELSVELRIVETMAGGQLPFVEDRLE